MRKPRTFVYVLAVVLTLSIVPCTAQAPAGLPKTLDGLAEGYHMPSVLAAYGTFTYEYTGLPTPFSRWLEDRLSEAAPKSSRVRILNRNAAAAMDPAFKETYGAFFKESGAEALLHGTFFQEGGGIRVRLELTDLSSRTLLGAADWRIESREIPAYAPAVPASDAAARARELARLGVAATGGLAVSVTTDRGPGAAYRDGEDMEIAVTVNKDAYVRLYHVDGSGRIQMIWPNAFGGGDGRIQGGQAVRLPGPNDPFRFRMGPPYGTEFIKALASTTPFENKEADFSDLGLDSRVMTRGLAVVGTRAPEAAEALASYYVGPAVK
ncbi:MAG TPA: DUF4384 domain-containing protein [Spirochaetia bacterium]|nr:DUF4384 domain-containing protein [Spirochaetia bacterium]